MHSCIVDREWPAVHAEHQLLEYKKALNSINWVLQLDIQAVYEQGGGAQVAQLERALEDPKGAVPADAEALRRMLGRIVWTPTMRRMYTLLSRWASDRCSAYMSQ